MTKALPLLILSALPLFAHEGHEHGPIDDTTKFITADIDVSGGLSLPEFTTTFATNTPAGQIKAAHKKSDSDRSGQVSLEEWLAYRATTVEGKAWAAFIEGDADEVEGLSLAEFAALHIQKKPFIHTRAAFLLADTDEDSLVSLAEWLAFSTRKNKTVKVVASAKFSLADQDGSDSLTVEEYATVFSPQTKPAAVIKKFTKLDRDDNGVLTRSEWNPGAKGSL
ncbi:hypothetical protein OKA04_20710 [Luteolibacter flavescens]|uniref:EF-hand domain-containing protein n=1 Tax=Luteolibacter flavescens TaxID=1859460 RepID=A0ABT3FUA4_9BACT|nr:hypothetical protein [Luteolibacter flavescens]MCW1887173.1 hypothetical protein [Luteolibacter flavescens]